MWMTREVEGQSYRQVRISRDPRAGVLRSEWRMATEQRNDNHKPGSAGYYGETAPAWRAHLMVVVITAGSNIVVCQSTAGGSAHDIHDSTHDSTSAEENNAIIRGGKQPHPSYLRYEYMHRDQSSLQTYGRHTPHLTPRMPLTRESARALPPPPPPSPPDTQDAVDQGTLIEVGHLYVSGPPEQQKGGGPGGVRKSCADTGYPSGRTRSVLQPPRRRWSTCQPGPT